MARPDGRVSRPGDGRAAAVGPAYVTRSLPFYAMHDEEALDRIEAQAFSHIEQIGLEFRDVPRVLEDWRAAGAKVAGTRVRAAPELVRGLLSTAPAKLRRVARNPARSVRIGGRSQVFAPVYGSPFMRDFEGGRR